MTALLCLFSCSGGDDDGRRLGEQIVGTWQRGWNEGDIIIEGDPDIKPENFTYDLFYFYGDGKYLSHAIDKKGNNVTIEGFWRLDDKENFVVWITHKSVKSGKKTLSSEKKVFKYVINALAPNQFLVYQVGDALRSAEWVK